MFVGKMAGCGGHAVGEVQNTFGKRDRKEVLRTSEDPSLKAAPKKPSRA